MSDSTEKNDFIYYKNKSRENKYDICQENDRFVTIAN